MFYDYSVCSLSVFLHRFRALYLIFAISFTFTSVFFKHLLFFGKDPMILLLSLSFFSSLFLFPLFCFCSFCFYVFCQFSYFSYTTPVPFSSLLSSVFCVLSFYIIIMFILYFLLLFVSVHLTFPLYFLDFLLYIFSFCTFLLS